MPELAVALAVGVALLAVLLRGIAYVEERAEKATVEEVVARIEIGLLAEAGSRMARGRGVSVDALAAENPVDWLARPPARYRGAYNGVAPASATRAYWYYDTRQRTLVYVPALSSQLQAGIGRDRIGYRVSLRGGRPRLEPAWRFTWFEQDGMSNGNMKKAN